jgi:hypothetical protein
MSIHVLSVLIQHSLRTLLRRIGYLFLPALQFFSPSRDAILAAI